MLLDKSRATCVRANKSYMYANKSEAIVLVPALGDGMCMFCYRDV